MGMPAVQAGPFSSNAAGFVGDLVDGVRHGYGVQTYRNGAKYAGEWKSDHPDGWGVILAADGRQSVGRFAINPRHGRGVQFFVNGEIDDNERVYWEEGVPSLLPQVRECLGIPEHNAATVAAIEGRLVFRAAGAFDDHRLVLVGAAAGSRAAEGDGFGAAVHSDRPATLGGQRNGSGGSCREPLKR